MLLQKCLGFAVVLVVLLSSCAQQVAPTGGKKDETPPRLVKAYPVNKTTHFSAPKIILQFDEFIVLNSASDQVIISPPLDERPEYTIEGKKLIIDFKQQKLKPSTTYTINFGNAIGDLHENNLLQNQTYVFCTGAALDSLRIAGKTENAFTNVAEKGMLVGLYRTEGFTDSTIQTERPVYFTRSRTDGFFLIENIPLQSYRVVSFTDENKNLKYDKNEIIGFSRLPIMPGDTAAEPLLLPVYTPDPYQKGRLLDTFSHVSGKFVLVAYKSEPNAISPALKPSYNWHIAGKNRIDTFVYFTSNKDTVFKCDYQSGDSVFNIRIQTRSKGKQPKFTTGLFKQVENNDSLYVVFSDPVSFVDTSLMELKQDSVVIVASGYKLSDDGRKFWLYYPWVEHKKYSFYCADSSFKDMYGRYNNDELKHAWVSKELKDYATLKLFVLGAENRNYILQLLIGTENNVYKEFYVNSDKTISLDYIIPGTYRIKFIEDTNQNKVWDNGNFQGGIAPERVFYYPEPLVLRAYWDIEQSIDIQELNK